MSTIDPIAETVRLYDELLALHRSYLPNRIARNSNGSLPNDISPELIVITSKFNDLLGYTLDNFGNDKLMFKVYPEKSNTTIDYDTLITIDQVLIPWIIARAVIANEKMDIVWSSSKTLLTNWYSFATKFNELLL